MDFKEGTEQLQLVGKLPHVVALLNSQPSVFFFIEKTYGPLYCREETVSQLFFAQYSSLKVKVLRVCGNLICCFSIRL